MLNLQLASAFYSLLLYARLTDLIGKFILVYVIPDFSDPET